MIGNSERIISLVSFVISSGVVIYLAPGLWGSRKQLDKRLLAFWVVAWCFCFGIFNLDDAYLFVGRISGIPNLGWLLIYAALTVGMYCVVVITSQTLQVASSKLITLAYITGAFLIALVAIFFASGIALAPARLVREGATSISELIYFNMVYVYQIVAFLMPLVLFAKMLFNSRLWLPRMRSAILVVVFVSAEMYSVLRIAMSLITYYHPGANVELIQELLVVAFIPAQTFWPLAFIPPQWFEFFAQNMRLYHMRCLYRQVQADCGLSLSIPLPNLLSQSRQASFYANAIAVFLLDIKWMTSKGRLVLQNDKLADMINRLDGSLSPSEFIDQCVAQSRVLIR